jgi:hypothetical protein
MSNDQQPTYDLRMEDEEYVEAAIRVVRRTLCRPTLTALQVHQLGALLFGLQRLPLQTPGVGFELMFKTVSQPDGYVLRCIALLDDRFELYDCESCPGWLGDREYVTWLKAELVRGRDDCALSLPEWFSIMLQLADDLDAELDIEDASTMEAIDWYAEPDPDAWSRLPSEFA